MIKLEQHREFTGLIKSCTLTQVPSGKYYISILVNTENIQLPKIDNKIGVDLGIKEFAITSNGDFFSNPKHLRKSEKRLVKLQKELSRKEKGSNNRKTYICPVCGMVMDRDINASKNLLKLAM